MQCFLYTGPIAKRTLYGCKRDHLTFLPSTLIVTVITRELAEEKN